jgi:hypothetical protein
MTTAKANLTGNLVRKQFLMSYSQAEKLLALSAAKGKSEAEIVRLAIDAYDPEEVGTRFRPLYFCSDRVRGCSVKYLSHGFCSFSSLQYKPFIFGTK